MLCASCTPFNLCRRRRKERGPFPLDFLGVRELASTYRGERKKENIMFQQVLSRYTDHALVLLRMVVGLLFMQHGMQKVFGLFGGLPSGPPGATAPLFSLPGVAGILELFGGLAVLTGFFTQPVAFLLSGEMAVAYFMVHAPQGLWPIQNRG